MVRFFRILLVCYLVGIALLTVVPLSGSGRSLHTIIILGLPADYIVHFLMFVPLVPLWRLGWPGHHWLLILVTGIIVASVMEGLHGFLSYRVYDGMDLLANVTGVVIGGILLGLFRAICRSGLVPERAEQAGVIHSR